MQRKLLIISGISGAIAVMLGAMGAHYLKSLIEKGILTPENLQSYHTAVEYQMYHTLALVLIAVLAKGSSHAELVSASHNETLKQVQGDRFLKWISNLFIIGIILFSGSIYILSTQSATGISAKWLGPITPLGGICFIAGWICLAIYATKSSKS